MADQDVALTRFAESWDDPLSTVRHLHDYKLRCITGLEVVFMNTRMTCEAKNAPIAGKQFSDARQNDTKTSPNEFYVKRAFHRRFKSLLFSCIEDRRQTSHSHVATEPTQKSEHTERRVLFSANLGPADG